MDVDSSPVHPQLPCNLTGCTVNGLTGGAANGLTGGAVCDLTDRFNHSCNDCSISRQLLFLLNALLSSLSLQLLALQ